MPDYDQDRIPLGQRRKFLGRLGHCKVLQTLKRKRMKVLVTAAMLVVGHLVVSSAPAFAQLRTGSRFTAVDTRAYNACLFAAWIEDYCRGNSWRPTANRDRVFATC